MSVVGGSRTTEGRVSESDRREKIACSLGDVIAGGSDAFLPDSRGHWGATVSGVRHSLSAARNFSCS